MQIAQLLFVPAGQADRETQIPEMDLGESVTPQAVAFDMIFQGQEASLDAIALPIPSGAEPRLEPGNVAQDQESAMGFAPTLQQRMGELPEITPKPVAEGPEGLSEVAEVEQSSGGVPFRDRANRALREEAPLSRVELAPSPATARVEGREAPDLPPQSQFVRGPHMNSEVPEVQADPKAPRLVAESALDEPVVGRERRFAQVPEANSAQVLPTEMRSANTERSGLDLREDPEVFPKSLAAQSRDLPGPPLQNERVSEPGVMPAAAQMSDTQLGADGRKLQPERPTDPRGLQRDNQFAPPSGQHAPQTGAAMVHPLETSHLQSSPGPRSEGSTDRVPAPNLVPGRELKAVPASDVMKQAPMPVTAPPLIFTVEQEGEQLASDEVGFGVVDQVSQTSTDLKPAAVARGAEVPRMVMAQIAEIVRLQPDRPVELTLNPEELGRLRMSFQSEGSAMHVVLSFERLDTLDLMRRHIDQLAQDMRELGMSDVSFTFQQQTSEDGGGAHSGDGAATLSHNPQFDREDAPDDNAPGALNIAVRAGVDIRV